MTALLVIGIILLVFLTILSFPVKLKISFDGELHAKVHFLFLRVSLTDQPKDNEKKTEEEKSRQSDSLSLPEKLKIFFKREGIAGVLSFLSDLTEVLLHSAKKLVSHIRIRRFHLQLCIATGDAYDTALLYGKACTVISGAYTALFTAKKCRDKSASVTCDYKQEESSGAFSAVFSLRAFFLLGEICRLLVKTVPLLMHFNRVTGKSVPAPKTSESA